MARKLTKDQVISMLVARQGNRTQRDLAKELKISQAYLCDVINGRREPGYQILLPLGLRKILYFVQITAADKVRR